MMAEAEHVLFVHAHPDDETITTGGTIATLVDRGASVTVLTCTRGERGEVIPAELSHLAESPQELAGRREAELHAALGILGVSDQRFLGAPDARWAGRAPRRYLDSGMSWGANGAEPADEIDPASLTAAEFGEVAADIAAVIVATRPDVVVSYNEWGGYGHPDHIRAHQAARRAAEVYGVPFYAVEPHDSSAETPMTVDVTPVLDRKRAALEAHRTQVVVTGQRFALSNGESQPIDTVERFRRVRRERGQGGTFGEQSITFKVVSALVALAAGLCVGTILTIFHQASFRIGQADIPIGLIVAVLLVALLLVGLRLVFETRLVAGFAAIGVMASVALLSLPSSGGSVIIPLGVTGVVWAVAPTLVALVVLAWPRVHRPRSVG